MAALPDEMPATLGGPRDPRVYLILRALTPIAHGDTSLGLEAGTNVRLFMRRGVRGAGPVQGVPALSENALRAVLFRRPLADHLLAALGIVPGTLPQSVVNLLYSGGAVLGGAKAPAGEQQLGRRVHLLYPHLALLSGAVDAFILPRSALKLASWPVAREFADDLRALDALPDAAQLAEEAEEVSAYDLLYDETRTRGTGDESAGNQMLYGYETIAEGTRFVVELTIDRQASAAVLATIPTALAAWDGYFGGQGRQGRGRLVVERTPALSTAAYEAHLDQHAERMHAGLVDGTLGAGAVLCAR